MRSRPQSCGTSYIPFLVRIFWITNWLVTANLIVQGFQRNPNSLAVTNSGGSLADIWPQSHRSVPFALFTTGSSLGPVIAPIVGGFISQVS